MPGAFTYPKTYTDENICHFVLVYRANSRHECEKPECALEPLLVHMEDFCARLAIGTSLPPAQPQCEAHVLPA